MGGIGKSAHWQIWAGVGSGSFRESPVGEGQGERGGWLNGCALRGWGLPGLGTQMEMGGGMAHGGTEERQDTSRLYGKSLVRSLGCRQGGGGSGAGGALSTVPATMAGQTSSSLGTTYTGTLGTLHCRDCLASEAEASHSLSLRESEVGVACRGEPP